MNTAKIYAQAFKLLLRCTTISEGNRQTDTEMVRQTLQHIWAHEGLHMYLFPPHLLESISLLTARESGIDFLLYLTNIFCV